MEHLYICDTFVEYIKAKKRKLNIKVQKQIKVEMPRGIITNGFIMDTDKFFNILKQLNIKPKNLRVLIDTNSIVFKKIDVPNGVSKNNLQKFVELGFRDIEEKDKEYLYSYREVKEKGHRYLVSFNAEEEKIENYIFTFHSLKWNILSLESANNSLFNVLSNQNNTDKPFSLIYLCNDILNIYFYEDKRNIVNFRTRILDEDMKYQVYENIVNTFRFSKMNLNDTFRIYTIGVSQDIAKELEDVNLDLSPLDREENIENWKYSYLYFNLFSKDKDRFNLLISYENKNKKKLSKSSKVFLYSGVFILCSLAGFSCFLKYQEMGFYEKNLKIETDILEIKESSLYLEYKEETINKLILEENIKNIEEVYGYVSNNITPLTSNQLYRLNELVKNATNIKILEYIYIRENNTFTIIGLTDDIMGGSQFAKKIRDLKVFEDVNYNLKELDYEKGYSFSIDCLVSELVKEDVIINEVNE